MALQSKCCQQIIVVALDLEVEAHYRGLAAANYLLCVIATVASVRLRDYPCVLRASSY
jgi:hypothetical protein